MQMIGSREASTRFGQLLSTVLSGTAVTVTRNNQETAIMLSPDDFQLLGGEKLLLKKKQEKLKESWERLSEVMDEIADEAKMSGFKEENLKDYLI